MELFDATIRLIHDFVSNRDHKTTWTAQTEPVWPKGGNRNIVLKEDMGLEMGSPETQSLSCILWTDKPELVHDKCISLVGPDISGSRGQSLPFAKIVLAAVSGFDEENTYENYRDMELIRYDLDLKGYMLRAVSQFRREWSRISTEAINKGLSFEILGSALMKMFREKSYINALEIIFVTSNEEDVRILRDITTDSTRMIEAMNKMAREADLECDECEYQDVCDDAGELKKMREAKMKKASGGSQ